MRILFLAGRELSYPRNDVLLQALRQLGNVDAVGDCRKGSIVWRSIWVAIRAFPKLLKRDTDLVVVGFYGHFLMLLVGLVARRPILFDAFVSTFDTLSQDRQQFAPGSLLGKISFWLDQTACRLADHVLLDTPAHADYFVQTFSLPAEKVSSLPVGCNEAIFFPRPSLTVRQPDQPLRLLHYSTFLPLHGTDVIVRAAALLQDQPIEFRLIGEGPQYLQVRQLAEQLHLQNVHFVPSIPLEQLPDEIAAADICLGGHFGASEKAGRVIPGKIYQMLAMGKPVLAADTQANQQFLTHGQTAYLCPPQCPKALAEAILNLARDVVLCARLGSSGRLLYQQTSSEQTIAEQVKKIVIGLMA
jgi:glycosyltransferase involved in cell wall biosynthesis